MKKALGQTVRDLKRGVNKKVLKVPGIEQKVLDATSNEPWGPHGSLLADIAMATRNYHEYQIIAAAIWKRISDTGKNWRHVYKGLTVLEYLVAHGSERIIDDIKEHAYQISSLSDFQYIDSSGRDQGSNIRKKSQGLVALVNDKERITEVRQKAAANKEKFRNSPPGGMRRTGSGGQGDRYDYDRYGSRDDYQHGYGKDKDYGYKDDDRHGRYSDSNSRDGDRYSRDHEDRSGRDGYRDDDYRNKSRSVDGDQYGTRSRSSDRDHAFDDDGASYRGSSVRDDDYSQDGRRHEQKFSEQNNGTPPSYEEAVSASRSPAHSERYGETSMPAVPRSSSPPASNNPDQATSEVGNSASPSNKKVEAFDAFDPRVSGSAAPVSVATPAPAPPTASTSSEIDLLGGMSDSWAVVPILPETPAQSGALLPFSPNNSASNPGNQDFDDPFGDGPFKAFPSADATSGQQQISTSMTTLQPSMSQNAEVPHPPSVKSEAVTDFNFADSFPANAYSATNASNSQPPSANLQFFPEELSAPNQENDILADIFPPSGPANDASSHTTLSASTSQGQHAQSGANPYGLPAQPSANPYGLPAQSSSNPYGLPAQSSANPYGLPAQSSANPYGQPAQPSANPYGQPAQPTANPYDQVGQPSANPYCQPGQPNANGFGQPAQPNANAFGQPAQPNANAFGQPAQPNANAFGQPAQPSANPYGQPAQSHANPYGQAAQPHTNPYGQSTQPHANPYGQPTQPHANPYGQPAQPNANPYGQPTQPNDNPYGQPAQPNANPYAQPTQSSSNNGYSNFSPQSLSTATQIPVSAAQSSNESLMLVSNAPVSSQMAAQPQSSAAQFNTGNFPSQHGSAMQVGSHSARPTPNELGAHNNNDVLGGFFSQPGSNTSMAPQMVPPSSTGALAIVPQTSKDKFEPKSAVWADTLSRGLINFNISGPKTNPLADIGVDFDAINRKEKRLEKPAPTAVPSTVTMGKAMGSGSGIGRAGASVLRAPANPMVGSGMSVGMGMGGGPVGGTGMGVYGGMNQQPMGMGMGMNMGMNPGMGMNNMGMNQGMGMNNMGMNQGMRMNMGMNQGMGMNMGMNQGMGMNMGMNPGMGVNMGMGQATHMQSQSGMPGSYNPMMGSSGYPQQPQGGGGYR